MPCVTYACADIEEHEVVICGEVVAGGQSAGILFTCDSLLAALPDLTDDAAINAAFATDVANGKAVKVVEVNWTADAGSPVQFGTQTIAARPNGKITNDYTAAIIDSNVNVQNDNFWEVADAASGRVWGGYIVHHAQTPTKAHYILPDNGLYVNVGKPMTGDTDPIHYVANLVYKMKPLARIINAPTTFTV